MVRIPTTCISHLQCQNKPKNSYRTSTRTERECFTIQVNFYRRIAFRIVPPGILHKETPQENKKICKEARPHRPSCEYLADFARKSTRCPQGTKLHCARVSTSIRMPTCGTKHRDTSVSQSALMLPFVGCPAQPQ